MSELVKMKIFGYTSPLFTGDHKIFEVQINPAIIDYKKGVNQRPDPNQKKNNKFKGYANDTLSFDLFFDKTGLIPGANKTIDKIIEEFENVVYNIDSESHEPHYIKISWGSFIFKGVITSLNYKYTLFAPDGSPLRVNLSLSFTGYIDPDTSNKKQNKKSPDLSRIITLKAGDSIAQYCNEIYGDASYCFDIARFNGLSNFRNVKPGTSLMFPPLVKNG